MIAGNLRNVNGVYHVCLNWYENGKRKTKSFTTKIKTNEKRAKKRAEEILIEYRKNYKPKKSLVKYIENDGKIMNQLDEIYLFDILDKVHQIHLKTTNLKPFTILNLEYRLNVFKRNINNIKLKDLNEEFIENSLLNVAKTSYYSSFKYFFSNINDYLLKYNYIERDLMRFVKSFKKNKPKPKVIFKESETLKFLEVIKTSNCYLEFYILVTLGLRASELLGLKFEDIDYINNRIFIQRNVVRIKRKNYVQDHLKTESSRRILPLSSVLLKKIESRKKYIEDNKKKIGNLYDYEYDGFICVNRFGDLKKYDLLAFKLRKLLFENNLPRVTLHGLRHTAATNLYMKGIDLKIIQHFLGHSKIDITSNLYAHFDYKRMDLIYNLFENNKL